MYQKALTSNMREYDKWSIAGPELVPGKKYCPEAIEDYAKLGHSKPSYALLTNVRQHLSYLGWKIECTVFKPCPSSLRYRYTCPLTGKVYSSLVLLCRDLSKASSHLRETHLSITYSRTEETLIMDDANIASKSSRVPDEERALSDHKSVCFEAMYEKIVRSCNGTSGVSSLLNGTSCLSSLLNGTSCLSSLHEGIKRRRRITYKREKSIVKYREKQVGMKRKRCQANLEDGNDQICSLCHYGGDILLCDGCPSSFHKKCLGLKEIPGGEFFCFMCCCYVCGDYSSELLVCSQCERKHHSSCSSDPLKHQGFCSGKCMEISAGLRNLREPILMGEGVTWRVVKCSENKRDSPELDEAIEVIHDCFNPVREATTGADMVESIFHGRGSQLKRVDFKGFYAMLLEQDGYLMSTGALRVLGADVAELPFIATRCGFQKQGFCRIMMGELENQLRDLGVKRIILPSAASTLDTWINKFGFSRVDDRSSLGFINFVGFQGSIVCEKEL